MSLLSYLSSHWALFIIVVLLVILLSAASWFLKNWKLAAAAIIIVVFGLAYQSSNMDGYKRKVSEDAQAQLSLMRARLGTLQLTAALDAQRAASDAYLNSKLDALSRETPPNSGACLSLDAARRVRAIGDQPFAAPLPSRRYPSLLQRRSAAP